MKVCPKCQFSNEDICPTCVWCNRLLDDVEAIPSTDPDNPEHSRNHYIQERHAKFLRESVGASLVYALAITVTAVTPGLILNPYVLLLYFLSAVAVAFAVYFSMVGQLTASFLQGVLSLALLWNFAEIHPLSFFMLYGHVVIPAVYWHWMNLIVDANR